MNKCLNCNKDTENPKFCSKKCCGIFIINDQEVRRKMLLSRKKLLTDEHKEKISISLLKKSQQRIGLLLKTKNFEDLPKSLIKKLLKEEKMNKCESCGFEYSDEKGNGPFEVHHKDGDRNNWKKENLSFLCLNCHWMTGTYKFKGRKHRTDSRKKISENNFNIGRHNDNWKI